MGMYVYSKYFNGLCVAIQRFTTKYGNELVDVAYLQGDDAEMFLNEMEDVYSVARGRERIYELQQNIMSQYDTN